MKQLLIILCLTISLEAYSQFKPETISYGYLNIKGKTVLAHYSRYGYETIQFQCKQILDARWAGTSIIIIVETNSGTKQTWRCDDKFKRTRLK